MTQVISRLPRKQRRYHFHAPASVRRRWLSAPLSRELRAKYGRRQLPVRKGDTVLVVGGSYVGREERVAKVDTRGGTIILDNVTLKKADQKLKVLPLRPSHLLLTRLNLSDPWRRRRLRTTEAGTEGGAAAKPEADGKASTATSAPEPPAAAPAAKTPRRPRAAKVSP
ncbi:MAG: 50S ribosomal protein L24 [Thermoplasmata archaeon]|jgi:large subunit ribosomal protein L24|nr:50S ribosomal protein L24 [Thermoplasmata archaeon]MCI4342254.1 50S ribosomal protein L24 [Thermoplasmata archaeon]